MIWSQTKRVVNALTADQRRELSVVAITMDPDHDTQEVLAEMASGQSFAAPLYNLCTGTPATVEATLDKFGVARTRDPETGVIDHANLFFLIDRSGRMAYKLTIGDRQERWLLTALRLLLSEPEPE